MPAKAETKRLPIPETTSLLWADPLELMRDNPAGLIVNRESYGRMEAHFSLEQFEPPQVVHVLTYSSGHEVVKLFVLDGLTRMKFIADHQDKKIGNYPPASRQIPVKDVTDSVLKNPLVVLPTDGLGNGEALTMLQYLRAVVPPTVEHSQIASDRIGAHLINAWENMVGIELSQKFSAIAGFSLLANRLVPTATDKLLQKFLETQNPIMAGETAKERAKLQQALRDMAAIIRQSKLFVEQVAEASFELVSARSPVIGGERETRKEVYGLLYLPEVEHKLVRSFPQLAQREQKREELGKSIADAFAKNSQQPYKKGFMDVLVNALKNPNLDFDQTISVLTSPSPTELYTEIRSEISKGRLMTECLMASQGGQLSDVEVQLVDRLGKKIYLSKDEFPRLAIAIIRAGSRLKAARKLADELTSKNKQLVQIGLRPELVGRWVSKLSVLEQFLLSVNSLPTLSQKVREIKDSMDEIIQTVQRQRERFLRERHTAQTVSTHKPKDADPSSRAVSERPTQPHKPEGLGPSEALVLPTTPDLQTEQQASMAPAVEIKPVQVRSPVPRSTPKEVSQAEDTIRVSNERLRRATESYHEMMRKLNLLPGDLSPSTKEKIDALLITIGRIRFGEDDLGMVLRDLLEDK